MEPWLISLKSVENFKIFIESGEFAELLGNIELSAAKTALSKQQIANDPIKQVWSAINHLETAFEAFKAAAENIKIWKTVAFSLIMKREKYMNKARFVACMMAICYKYLGENQLYQQQINIAKKTIFDEKDFDDSRPPALFVFSLLTYVAFPIIFVEMGISAVTGDMFEEAPKVREDDIIELERILNSL